MTRLELSVTNFGIAIDQIGVQPNLCEKGCNQIGCPFDQRTCDQIGRPDWSRKSFTILGDQIGVERGVTVLGDQIGA